jgi:hypothetical protein
MSDGYSCVVPFLTDDVNFAHGVEVGMLYQKMRDPWWDVIEDSFLIDNQEQITLMANRLGWRVAFLMGEEGGAWFRCRLERVAT